MGVKATAKASVVPRGVGGRWKGQNEAQRRRRGMRRGGGGRGGGVDPPPAAHPVDTPPITPPSPSFIAPGPSRGCSPINPPPPPTLHSA